MNPALRLYHLARADFYERVRRHGFLVALLFCVYAGYAFLPPNPSHYVTLKIDEYRGVYNSAWVGAAEAMLAGTFLSLIGFFIVKNAVERDRSTRVGEILATTPISRVQYTIGKTLSNFAVLAAMALIVSVACIGMQILRGEDRAVNVLQIISPFVLITMPMLFVTAAVAVLFETLPVLRSGMGNIVFVFLWGFSLASIAVDQQRGVPGNDPLGNGIVLPSMFESCKAAFPSFDPAHASVSMGVNIRDDGEWLLKTFRWNGIDWTAQKLMWRLSWILAGLGIGALAAVPFDRFDPARARGWRQSVERKRRGLRAFSRVAPMGAPHRAQGASTVGVIGDRTRESAPQGPAVPVTHLTPLTSRVHAPRLGALVIAEWKLIARGLRWWYIGPIAVTIASFTAPLAGVRAVVLPLAWFWPVLLWSKLGTREARHGTEPILFSSPHPLSRQLAATWIAGVMLSIVAAWPVAVRLIIAGETRALAAWMVGAAFAPALALALGVWTRSGKFFEALYTGLLYAILQQATPLDFMGAVPAATDGGLPTVYAGLTLVLLLAALLGRQRRLRT